MTHTAEKISPYKVMEILQAADEKKLLDEVTNLHTST